MGVEKLPTSGRSSTDPSTNSVSGIDIGKSAADGQRSGQAANREFNEGLNRRSNDRQPGNDTYFPK